MYEKPEVDVILYEDVDIITLSGDTPILPPDEPIEDDPWDVPWF